MSNSVVVDGILGICAGCVAVG